MNLHARWYWRIRALLTGLCCALLVFAIVFPASAINITVDYRYDTNNFFNTQQKRDAVEAAATRLSSIITSSLFGVTFANDSTDARIGFTHPGTGASFEVSPATSSSNDALVTLAGAPPANEYRGPWSIAANEWILYAGGRSLTSAAIGGTATGTNFTNVFTSGTSHTNRGFRSTGSVNNLPVWGGAISFDNDGSTNWHYNHLTAAPNGTVDFYSIALHEIGHALGLSTTWLDWTNKMVGNQFYGTNALQAYNADNSASLTSFNLSGDRHFQDGVYDSRIFLNGNPNLVGTVGSSNLQDLIMEPTANFTGTLRRFEFTNVDVAALRDVGWATLPQLAPPSGDFNNNGRVDAADYVLWRKGVADGSYSLWRTNFGRVISGAGGAVPEPSSAVLICLSVLGFCFRDPRRRRSSRV